MATEKRLIDAGDLWSETVYTEKGNTMIDKVVYFLSEEFRKEGLLVPFGTTYRIAENLIAKQNECADELICCRDCICYDTVGCADGFGWCKFYDKGMKDNDFCSHGGRINYAD